MEFVVLGWPDEGPRLRLDHRQFGYAGKFVMTSTGKAVALDPGGSLGPEGVLAASADTDPIRPGEDDPVSASVLGAVAFNPDRTDEATLWLRYVTVRDDRRGDGVGPRLVAFVCDRARGRGYERVRIAVNNPFAYQALYKAGFRYAGEQTGIAELVLARSLDPASGADSPGGSTGRPDPERYRSGLAEFARRDLDDAERAFVERKRRNGPPAPRLAEELPPDGPD